MAEVSNRQLNISLAGQIALNLDKQDEQGQDGKITKSVWEDFWNKNGAEFKGKNENVGENGISVREAMGLIMTRLYNAAKATGKSVDEVAKNLFKESGGEKIDANSVQFADEEVNPTEENTPVKEVKEPEGTSPAKKAQRPTVAPALHETPPDFSKIARKGHDASKANLVKLSEIYLKEAKNKYNDFDNRSKNGYKAAQEYINFLTGKSENFTKSIDKNNAAFVGQYVINHADNKTAKWILNAIVSNINQKAKELGIKSQLTKDSDFNAFSSICEAIIKKERKNLSDAVDSAQEELDAYKTLNKPNESLANKTIKNKHSGKTYLYDEEGSISKIIDKNGKIRYEDGSYYSDDGTEYYLEDDSSVICYDEPINFNSEKMKLRRDKNGLLMFIHSEGFTARTNENGKINRYHKKYDKDGITFGETRDKDGNLMCYYEETFDESTQTALVCQTRVTLCQNP